MNKRVLTIAGAVALIALTTVPFAFAQRAGHGRNGFRHGMANDGGMMMFGHLNRAKEQLGLSDQQVTDIKAIFQSLHEQNAQYRQSMHGGMANIAQTLLANPNDLAAAQAILDQQTANEKAMKANMLTAVSKALNVLTPEQRTKLQEHLRDRVEHFREK